MFQLRIKVTSVQVVSIYNINTKQMLATFSKINSEHSAICNITLKKITSTVTLQCNFTGTANKVTSTAVTSSPYSILASALHRCPKKTSTACTTLRTDAPSSKPIIPPISSPSSDPEYEYCSDSVSWLPVEKYNWTEGSENIVSWLGAVKTS